MKREPFSGFSKVGRSVDHRFPTLTLVCSVGILIGGLRMADVLPLPRLPHVSAQPTVDKSLAPRPYGTNIGGAGPTAFGEAQVPGFPGVSLPGERITLKDVSFQPVHVPLWPMASRLAVRSDKTNLSLVDPRTDTVIWAGTVADAHFVYSNVSGTQTLCDEKGVVLWSDVPTPDLLFEKSADGSARLSDKRGKTLWAGHLTASPPNAASLNLNSRGDHRGTTYTLDFAGVRVNGINGYFTVIDGTGDSTRILWSGTLPIQPVMLFREDHDFFFWGADRSEGGTDRTTDIRLTQEPGRATIADARDQVLGEQSINLLKVESTVHTLGTDRTIPVPQQYCVPYGNLAKSGSVLFTYRDAAGNVIRKNSVVREGDVQRVNNNGMPF